VPTSFSNTDIKVMSVGTVRVEGDGEEEENDMVVDEETLDAFCGRGDSDTLWDTESGLAHIVCAALRG
jgi:hypothetical protein